MSTEISKKENQELNLMEFGTKAQIEALKSASFPDLDMNEFIIAMKIAKQYMLDPFAKDIWGWKQKGKTMIVVSNSGYMKIARQQPWFLSITAQPVFPGDDFIIDYSKNEITHKVNFEKRVHKDNPIGAYAILDYISNGEKMRNIKFVSWEEYARQSTTYDSVWNKQKSAMICKVATTVVCREVYGLSGLYTEEEIQKDDRPETRTITPPDLSKLQIPEIITNQSEDEHNSYNDWSDQEGAECSNA